MTSDDRRSGHRHLVWFPIRVDTDDHGEGVAIAKNVSNKGLLLASPQRLTVGAPVKLTLHLDPETGDARDVQGTVVRIETNDADPEGLWPRRVAIEFDDPDPELMVEVLTAGGGAAGSDSPLED